MVIQISELGDIAGKYDISNNEAERLVNNDRVVDLETFEYEWQNTDWWTDDNNA